jgi:hypothetical protein
MEIFTEATRPRSEERSSSDKREEGMNGKGFWGAVIFSLALCGGAPAQERTVTGEFSLAPTQVDVKGNRAKFNEYRDLRDGVYGHIGLRTDTERTYFDFRADDMGYQDQKYELEGGSRGKVTFHFGYDEIPHNLSPGNGPSVGGKPFIR